MGTLLAALLLPGCAWLRPSQVETPSPAKKSPFPEDEVAKPFTVRDVVEAGEPWRPYRTIASWYLWRSLE